MNSAGGSSSVGKYKPVAGICTTGLATCRLNCKPVQVVRCIEARPNATKNGALWPPPASFEGNHPSSPKQLYDGHSPSATAPAPRRVPAWLPALVLVAAVFLAYMRVWHAGFIWDDDDTLPGIRASSVRSASGHLDQQQGCLLPLVLTSFWVQHAIWGLNLCPITWST